MAEGFAGSRVCDEALDGVKEVTAGEVWACSEARHGTAGISVRQQHSNKLRFRSSSANLSIGIENELFYRWAYLVQLE